MDDRTPGPGPVWLAALAFVSSLIWPGSGQIMAGARRAALGFFGVCLVLDAAYHAATEFLFPGVGNSVLVMVIVLVLAVLGLASGILAVMQIRAPRPAREQGGWRRSAWVGVGGMIVAYGLVHVVLPVRWHSYFIPSASNEPTLMVGDRFFAGMVPVYAAGDIVVFRPPGEPDEVFVKRIVGLPGDEVRLEAGRLYVNGAPVSRVAVGAAEASGQTGPVAAQAYRETLSDGVSYEILKTGDDGPANDTPDFTVPAGDVFVLGDNRDNSLDSRFLNGPVGYVPLANVIGKVGVIYWPPGRAGAVR